MHLTKQNKQWRPRRAVACCATAAALTAPVLSRHRRHARRDAVGEAWAESVKEEFAMAPETM